MQKMDPTYEYGEAVDADSPPSLSARTLRRLLYLAFAALAVLLLVLLPPLISVNRYQKRIANSISDSLGRPVHLDKVSLNVLPLPGFILENLSWTRNRTVVMQLSLNMPRTLSDGSTSFNQVALNALNIWNQYLVHLRFSAKTNSPVPPMGNDEEMSVFFSDTVFGDTFGSGTLAITILNSRGPGLLEESDTIFNTSYTWDSYRGAVRRGIECA